MAGNYLRSLTAKPRTPRANLHLGIVLATVAGALNAGGFLAVGQYTSHMTGMVSMFADQLVLGNFELVSVAAGSWLAFALGAACTAVMVSYGNRRGYRNAFARPLLLEAALILVFGIIGRKLEHAEFADISLAVILLCFTMGLQNALITKVSRAEIRTTHVTGLTTDLGIELGKLFYWNRTNRGSMYPAILANRDKLRVHLILIGAFLFGGIAGAVGFKYVGFVSAVPLAVALACIALANEGSAEKASMANDRYP